VATREGGGCQVRRLEEIYVFITEQNGNEGVAAFWNTRLNRIEAMIASSEERKDELLEIAVGMVSLDPSKPIRVTKFSSREDLHEVVVADEDEPA
jgi:hypothetical protein